MGKNKFLWFIAALLGAVHIQAQTPTITLEPNPALVSQCVQTPLTYVINGSGSSCHTVSYLYDGDQESERVSVPVTSVTNNNVTTFSFTISWNRNKSKAKLRIQREVGATCPAVGDEFEVILRTFNNFTPKLEVPSSLPVGVCSVLSDPSNPFSTQIYYNATAELKYKNNAPNDPTINPADGIFTWRVDNGSTSTTSPMTTFAYPPLGGVSIPTLLSSLQPTLLDPINITVTAHNNCAPGMLALNSLPATKTIKRELLPPCPLTSTIGAASPYVLCGETGEFSMSATFPIPSGACLPSGVALGDIDMSYTWTVPSGWTIDPTTVDKRTINIIPNGTSGGTVSVKANASYNGSALSSKPCEINVPLRTFVPGTVVSGPASLCTSGQYSLSKPLPAGSSATWEITTIAGGPPNTNFVATSGTGATANIATVAGANGRFRITFTIGSTACGFETLSASFDAGVPRFSDIKVDGSLSTSMPVFFVCPGSRIITASVSNDADNCIQWSSMGTPSNPSLPLSNVGCSAATAFISSNTSSGTVTLSATNECGTTTSIIVLITKREGCRGSFQGGMAQNVQVYPNPAADHILISADNEDLDMDAAPLLLNGVQIMDIQGNLLIEDKSAQEQILIEIGGLKTGSYLLRTRIGSEVVVREFKVVRE